MLVFHMPIDKMNHKNNLVLCYLYCNGIKYFQSAIYRSFEWVCTVCKFVYLGI
jgi:hypothetical protein